MVSSWLDSTPVPDLPTLTNDELLDVWAVSRNSTLGVMAAEEITRRLFDARKKRLAAADSVDKSKM